MPRRSGRRPDRALVVAAMLSGTAENCAHGRSTVDEALAEMARVLRDLTPAQRQRALDYAARRYLADDDAHSQACAALLRRAGAT